MSKKVDGFEKPNYTQVPNKFFDEIMCEISYKSELIITMAIIRKTFGWHKGSDKISQSQLSKITGMGRKSVKRGLKYGIERGTIVKIEESTPNQAAEYGLNFKNFDIEKDEVQTENSEGASDPGCDDPGRDTSSRGGMTPRVSDPIQKKGLKERSKESNNNNKRACAGEEEKTKNGSDKRITQSEETESKCSWSDLEEPLSMITYGNTVASAHFLKLKKRVEENNWQIEAIIAAIDDVTEADRPSFTYLVNRLDMVEEYFADQEADTIDLELYNGWLEHKKQKNKKQWKQKQEKETANTGKKETLKETGVFEYDSRSDNLETKLSNVHQEVFDCKLTEKLINTLEDFKRENTFGWDTIFYIYKLINKGRLDKSRGIVDVLEDYSGNMWINRQMAENYFNG